jgi:hypothetical protein
MQIDHHNTLHQTMVCAVLAYNMLYSLFMKISYSFLIFSQTFTNSLSETFATMR